MRPYNIEIEVVIRIIIMSVALSLLTAKLGPIYNSKYFKSNVITLLVYTILYAVILNCFFWLNT